MALEEERVSREWYVYFDATRYACHRQEKACYPKLGYVKIPHIVLYDVHSLWMHHTITAEDVTLRATRRRKRPGDEATVLFFDHQ